MTHLQKFQQKIAKPSSIYLNPAARIALILGALTTVPWIVVHKLYIRQVFVFPLIWRLATAALLAGWVAALLWRFRHWRPRGAVSSLALGAIGLLLTAIGIYDFVIREFIRWDLVFILLGQSLLVCSWVISRSLQGRLLVIFIASVLPLIAVEIIARSTGAYQRLTGLYQSDFKRDFHHNYIPNSIFVKEPSPYDEWGPATNTINSLGIRGPEFLHKSANILFLGDSFIQSDQTAWENTLGQVLQSQLGGTGLEATVVAHGMGSWSPLLEWNWYLKIGRRFSPKVVFLFVFWNDFTLASENPDSDEGYLKSVVWDQNKRPDYFALPESAIMRLFRKLYVVQMLRLARYRSFAKTQNRQPNAKGGGVSDSNDAGRLENQPAAPDGQAQKQLEDFLDLPASEFERQLKARRLPLYCQSFWQTSRPLGAWSLERLEALSKSEAILKLFAEDVGEDGGRLILVYVPHPWQISFAEGVMAREHYGIPLGAVFPAASGVQQWLTNIVQRNTSLVFLDPTDAMRQYVAKRAFNGRLYLTRDGHWSKEGHRFMADFIASWYTKNIVSSKF